MFLRNVRDLKPDMFLVAGGCSSFGHSCFGGHGKRADEGVLLLPGADSDQQQRLMFPARETGSEDGEDTMIQPEGYGALSPASSASLVPSTNRLSPFLRQWASIASRSSLRATRTELVAVTDMRNAECTQVPESIPVD